MIKIKIQVNSYVVVTSVKGWAEWWSGELKTELWLPSKENFSKKDFESVLMYSSILGKLYLYKILLFYQCK